MVTFCCSLKHIFTIHYYLLPQIERRISLANKKIAVSKTTRRLVVQENVAAYLFLLPFLVFFVGFVLYPMFMCVYTSFFDATMGREDIFIRFDNYVALAKDPIFWKALWNTMIIVLVSVPVTCAFSLWVASIISKMPVVATSAFRCIFYLPVVTGSVAVTMVWKWMFNNYYGILNYLGTSTGAAISLVLALIFAVSFAFRKVRG